jgi:hypothetical protein
MRGLFHFKIRGKLASRYNRPFKNLEQRGEVAYQLELPPQLSDVHNVVHASQLRGFFMKNSSVGKCVGYTSTTTTVSPKNTCD